MSSITREWVDFFIKAGVPSGEAASYALIFAKNRIQKNMLADLNKEYLLDMGITPLGDIIAILKHARSVHEKNSRALIMTETAAQSESFLSEFQQMSARTPFPPQPTSLRSENLKHNKVDDGVGLQEPILSDKKSQKRNSCTITRPIDGLKRRHEPIKRENDCLIDSDEDVQVAPAKLRPFKDSRATGSSNITSLASSSSDSEALQESPDVTQKVAMSVFTRLGGAAAVAAARTAIGQLANLKSVAGNLRKTDKLLAANLKKTTVRHLESSVTTDLSDEDEVAVRASIPAMPPSQLNLRKLTPTLASGPKKVRFGGTAMRRFPEGSTIQAPVFKGHTVVVKKETPEKQPQSSKFLLNRVATERHAQMHNTVPLTTHKRLPDRQLLQPKPATIHPKDRKPIQLVGIKGRVGVVRPTPAKPISKMVSDTMLLTGEKCKSNIKSRINLKAKTSKSSVLDRLG